jgi:hypothetical protein
MQRHLILTNGRSGSNYLVNVLNSHPQLTNYGEVLGNWILPYKLHKNFKLGGDSPVDYLHYIYSSKTFFYFAQIYSALSRLKKGKHPRFKEWSQVQSIGIKDFTINIKKRQLQPFFQNQDDLLVINLYRENTLKRVLSRFLMKQTGTVKLDNHAKQTRSKLAIPLDVVIRDLEIFEQETQEQFELVSLLPSENVLHVRYEDLFESEQSQNDYRDQIFEFLNVKPLTVQSSHRKILSDDLSSIISNYQELCEALERTRFSKYLYF